MSDFFLPGDRRTRLHPVSRERPCVLCGGDHKCARGDDGILVCGRAPGDVPGFHCLGPCRGDPQFTLYRREEPPPRPTPSRAPLPPAARAQLADLLGLPETVLERLPGLGFLATDPHGPCWLFPECDGNGVPIGATRRYADGSKKATPGSRRGLIVPSDWHRRPGPVFCPEGASDTLTLCALGLAAVGRPSNSGGAVELVRLLGSQPANRPLVIVGDFDPRPDGSWPGRDGARRTADLVARGLGRSVLWTLPPAGAKDVRDWARQQRLDPRLADAWSDAGERLAVLLQSHAHLADPAVPLESNDPAGAEPRWEPPVPLSRLPAGVPFPTDVLPAPLASFCRLTAVALGCPVDFVGLPLLVLAGAAIGASRAVQVKPGWCERPCLYAAIVGRPGSAKSPALKIVATPVYALQQQLKERFDQQRAVFEEAQAVYDAWARKRTPEGTAPERPAAPTLARVYAGDATVESLAPLLQANPRGLVLIRDELSALVTGLNQYKAGRGSDRQFYLSAWAGEPSCVDRRRQEEGPVLVPHPFLAVVGGLQPDLLGCLRDRRGSADGFADRFLFAYPDVEATPAWTWEGIPAEEAAAWARTLEELRRLELEVGPQEQPRPQLVPLSDAGRAAWEAFTRTLTAELAEPDFPPGLRDPWSKLRGYGARLALIVHELRRLTEADVGTAVDGASVERAAALVRYFQGQARRVWAAVGADPEATAAQEVLDWLARQSGVTEFSRTWLHRQLRFRQHFASARSLDVPLRILEQHGYVRRLGALAHPGPGRKPSDRFGLNPLWVRGGEGGR